MQPYNTRFTLSRDYLAECFDQTLPYGKNARPSFLLPGLFLAFGAGLLIFTEHTHFVGILFIAFAALELIHIRFRRAWWLTRQMLGKSSDSEVKLTIDEDGIRTKNPYTQTTLLWADIECVIETDLGLILVTNYGGRQYLSKSLFSVELISEIVALNKN